MIDLISLLESQGIDYRESGVNVTRGWVNVSCPFPFCSDPSFHLGINTESNLYHCWVCGEKGHLKKLLHTILRKPYYEIEQIINSFETYQTEEQEEKIIQPVNTDLLKPYDNNLPALHRNYLISRNFDPDFIQKKYHIRYQYWSGYFAYRIIIPVIENGQIINLTGRDVSGKQEERYKHLPNDKAILPMKEVLYNIDSIRAKVIVVEGPTDCWRIGDGSVGTMGVEYTQAQIKLLANKNLKKAFILFDKEAEKNAEKLANALSSFVGYVEVLYLDKGDPADMDQEEVKTLRKEIGI